MFKNKLAVISITTSIALLSGCLGGGDSSSSTPAATPSPLQGVFTGSNSNGYGMKALVLEDGSFWNIWGNSTASGLTVLGISDGTSSAGNSSYTISFTDFVSPGSSPISGTGSGTYTSSTLIGSVTEAGQNATFNLATPVSTTYNYNTAAVPSAITGAWSGSLLDGETGSISVSSSGTLSGTSSLGCSFTGTVIPRPSGVNVFNMAITFGAAPCTLPSQTVTGIALTYPLGNGTNQLIAAVVNSSQTKASAFFAVR